MKLLYTTLLCLLVQGICLAQYPQGGGGWGGQKAPALKGKIVGSLLDSTTLQPVGYATLVLFADGKDKEQDGVLSDENGGFKFADVPEGKYRIAISFLGYEDKTVSDVEITLKNPDNNLGDIFLSQSTVLLDAVNITEKRALVEMKVDKIVFNAEDDASIAGGDATDVLRKVPTLSVDLEGNVSLRGSQSVRILINGKPSGMFSTNVADALKMFPADQIKSVEVITSPTAKYDGEGSAGLINIITKKSNIEGAAGSVDLSVGNRQNSVNGNLSYGKGRFGSSINGRMHYSTKRESSVQFDRVVDYSDATQGIYSQKGYTNSDWRGGNGSASAFYDFNAYNAINGSISYRGMGSAADSIAGKPMVSSLIDLHEDIEQYISRTSNTSVLNGGYDANIDYTKKFEKNKEQELVFAAQLSGSSQKQDYTVNELVKTVLPVESYESKNRTFANDGENLETTLQVDYVQPLPNSKKLEIGTKAVLRDITSAFGSDFKYQQDVLSAYSQLYFVVKKFQFTTGVRYEQTRIDIPTGSTSTFLDSYHNFFPNLSISRPLKNFQNLKLSYSKRIQRPSLFFINPFVNNADEYNVSGGNPSLQAEIVDQLELSYNTAIKGFGIFTSVFYKLIDNQIESIMLLDGTTSQSFYVNIIDNNSVGLNLFVSKNVNNFTARAGFNIYTYNSKGIVLGYEVDRSRVLYDVFASGDYAIKPTIKVDFFGFFRAPTQTIQGFNTSFWMTGIGIRKDFKNSSLGIRIIDPFFRNKVFSNDVTGYNLDGDTFTQVSETVRPFRSIGLTYKYKFGKVDFKERKSKVKNTDAKSEGGDGGGGGFGG